MSEHEIFGDYVNLMVNTFKKDVEQGMNHMKISCRSLNLPSTGPIRIPRNPSLEMPLKMRQNPLGEFSSPS